jgi:hypothetical protein
MHARTHTRAGAAPPLRRMQRETRWSRWGREPRRRDTQVINWNRHRNPELWGADAVVLNPARVFNSNDRWLGQVTAAPPPPPALACAHSANARSIPAQALPRGGRVHVHDRALPPRSESCKELKLPGN